MLTFSEEKYLRGLISHENGSSFKRFKDKLRKHEKITYGAIGGSITAGGNASPVENAFAPQFSAWLNIQTECTLINAGIGATTSMYGAFRAKKDMLQRHPDIITIEFAVNDIRNPDTGPSFEWLVRQCVLDDKQPLVILVFTMFEDGSNMQNIHIPIGKHYGLPMLSYRDAVYPDITEKKLAWNEISPDEVHPNNTGHSFIASMLKRFIAGDPSFAESEYDQKKKSWFNPDASRYANGKIIDADEMNIIKNTGWLKRHAENRQINLYTSSPGALLELEFTGTIAVIGTKKYAGDFGCISAVLDDNPPVMIDGFYEKPETQAWAGGHIILTMPGKNLSPKKHVLKLELLENKHADSNGHQFEIAYLLIS